MQRGLTRVLIAIFITIQLACGGVTGPRGSNGSARPAPHFKPGFNLFKPEQDIEMGRQSAAQIERQLPLLNDEMTVNYIRQLGGRLASKAPGYNFPYQFNVVATKDINAFALPGGFIFVNAGAIIAAKNEGELAGVIAHEITHVALRHGTNQATKAYIAKAGVGILSTILGAGDRDSGQIIGAIGGLGANMLFLKFGRAAETQADLEGARIMASAGYDPSDMASFFKTLQEKGGQRVPEFLSDHPDPGNRVQKIKEEMPQLQVSANPTHDTDQFEQVKAHLTGAPLKSSEDLRRVGPADPGNNTPGARPEAPAASMQDFQAPNGSFSMKYPQNWDALGADNENLIFAPKGAYGQTEQGVVVTHGIFIGTTAPASADLDSANAAFVEQQVKMNPDYRIARNPQPINFNGRTGYATIVAGPSTVTGVMEVDVIYTTATSDGKLFYLITMAPQDEMKAYQATFDQIIGSLQVR